MRALKSTVGKHCLQLLPALFLSCSVYAGEPSLAGRYKGYNLLIISMTNIGTEHMDLYGYGRKTTPELDKWAAGALGFEDVFTPASWTLPDGTSLFTSLTPYAHKVMVRRRNRILSEKIDTLPELLETAGYRTAAFTGGLDYMKGFGHMRGFGTMPDNPPFTRFSVTIPQASAWLAKNSGNKFFLFVHGYDAHPPFAPTSRFKGVFSSTEAQRATVDPRFFYRGYMKAGARDMTVYYPVSKKTGAPINKGHRDVPLFRKTTLTRDDMAYLEDLYDEDILDVDHEVGAFLASLDKNLLEKTIVVVLSEHGEMFAKHGRFGRAGTERGTLYDDVVHIPLLIKAPGVQGGRVRGLVELVDIMPTLTEMLGVPLRGKVQGLSLLPLISSGTPVNEYVYAGTMYNAFRPERYTPYAVTSLDEYIRSSRWKLIHETTFPDPKDKRSAGGPLETYELYDIAADPGETVNVAEEYPDVVRDLSGKLKHWAETSRKFSNYEPSIHNLPAAVLEDAKQHGYW